MWVLFFVSWFVLIITPLTFLVFLVWIEFILSRVPKSESIGFVGQWTPLVAVGMVIGSAVLVHYWPRITAFRTKYRQRRQLVELYGPIESRTQSVKAIWEGQEKHAPEEDPNVFGYGYGS